MIADAFRDSLLDKKPEEEKPKGNIDLGLSLGKLGAKKKEEAKIVPLQPVMSTVV